MREFRRTHAVSLLVVISIYIAARFWGLTGSCLWFDEIFSVHAAADDWGPLWSLIALDLIHPPLFYALLKLWIGVGGDGLMWLRLLPLIISIIAIFPFLSLGVELKITFWTRLLAFLFLAVNGSLIKYSQEVRMYSLLMCLSLFSMWLLVRYFQKGKSLMALTVVNVLLVWTHYFGWFVIASEVAAILIFQRIKWRAITTMFTIVFVSFLPWVIAIIFAAEGGSGLSQNIGWIARPGIAAIAQLKLALVEPFYFQASSIDPISMYKISVPILLIAGTASVLYLIRWKDHRDEEKLAAELLALFTALPLVAAFAASWLLPYSIWGSRHLIIVFAPASILISLALTRIPLARLRVAFVSFVFLFTGYAATVKALEPAPQFIWCAWPQLAENLDPGMEYHLYASEDEIAYQIWFATRHRSNVRVTKLEVGVPEDRAYFLPRGFDDVDRINVADLNENEFWFAYRSRDGILPSVLAAKGYFAEDSRIMYIQNTQAELIRLRNK